MLSRLNPQTLAVSALLATSAAAQAEGLYAGGSLARSADGSVINDIASLGGSGMKLFVGEMQNSQVGAEFGLVNLGHASSGNRELKGYGFFFDYVGQWELAPKWSLLGRAGLVHARFNTSLGDDASTGLKLGTGVQFALTPQVALRLEYERYQFIKLFDSKARLGQASLGLKVAF